MEIEGQTAVVTGAASGLGRAVVHALSTRGASVGAIDLPGAMLEAMADAQVLPVAADVADGPAMEAAFQTISDWRGRPRILVNCAGILAPARVFRIEKRAHGTAGRAIPRALDDLRRVIEVNLIGTFNPIRLFAAALADGTGGDGPDTGVIVNTASVAAFEGLSAQAGYGASKAGVAAMTLPLARELARYGIRVVSVAPGAFDAGVFGNVPAHTQAQLIRDVPFPHRLGRPEEFARLVVEIIGNQMLNGAVLRIDGAVRMREPAVTP
ncbi:MAG: SDR family NAD(P)-dependent oxidoreductase [Pararhodobacter sp.]|nr:SDR family NAD(P)-dependent oxidoreductase [Pararhodobacter sp.]